MNERDCGPARQASAVRLLGVFLVLTLSPLDSIPWTPGVADGAVAAQEPTVPPADSPDRPDPLPTDSTELRERADELQAAFESYREARIPPSPAGRGGSCDELIGRFCLRHGGDDAPIPAEPPEVGLARGRLLSDLGAIASRIPGDGWILGQRVYYTAESGNLRGAERLARDCALVERWWCHALLGYVLHRDRRFLEADDAFAAAFATMPPDDRAWYRDPEFVLDPDGRELFEDAGEQDREALSTRLWLLSDPLYLVEGNDRRTAHLARRTLTRIRAGTITAYGIPFDGDRDLEELNVRYGGERGYERIQGRPSFGAVRDTRRIVGRHPPNDREYVPTGSFLEDPAEIPPGAWTLEEAEPRTGYVAPYAEAMGSLESQVARFRRGDSLFVVASYRPVGPRTDGGVGGSGPDPGPADGGVRGGGRGGADDAPSNPFFSPDDFLVEEEPDAPADDGRDGVDTTADGPTRDVPIIDGPVESGFFLLDWNGTPVHDARAASSEAVVTAQVPNGEYVVGLEVLEADASRAWRTRQGIRQLDLAFGQSAVSDLLFLSAGDALPTTLEEGLPRVLPAIRIRSGERFTVAWEVYGLMSGEIAQVTLGFTEGEPGLLQRIGEFLRVVEPEDPVEIRFEDQAAARPGTVFRAMDVEVPSFEPGVYSLHLEVRLPGRTPMVTSRWLTVEE